LGCFSRSSDFTAFSPFPSRAARAKRDPDGNLCVAENVSGMVLREFARLLVTGIGTALFVTRSLSMFFVLD
jgi:hypothetical protein